MTLCYGCEVILAHRKQADGGFFSIDQLPVQKVQHPTSIDAKCVKLSDGSSVNADSLLFATGYDFDYKFLQLDNFSYDNKRVQPLFQHLLHLDHLDSLAFLAVSNKIVPFPFMDHQMRYLMRAWFEVPTGNASGCLPSIQEASQHLEKLHKSNETRPKHYLQCVQR